MKKKISALMIGASMLMVMLLTFTPNEVKAGMKGASQGCIKNGQVGICCDCQAASASCKCPGGFE